MTANADDPERLLFDGNLGKQTIQAMHGHVRFRGIQSESGLSGHDNEADIQADAIVP
jgi:hypothetical protein